MTGFDARAVAVHQLIRLMAPPQRAEKSSVFSEWRFGQILSRLMLRQTNHS